MSNVNRRKHIKFNGGWIPFYYTSEHCVGKAALITRTESILTSYNF